MQTTSASSGRGWRDEARRERQDRSMLWRLWGYVSSVAGWIHIAVAFVIAPIVVVVLELTK